MKYAKKMTHKTTGTVWTNVPGTDLFYSPGGNSGFPTLHTYKYFEKFINKYDLTHYEKPMDFNEGHEQQSEYFGHSKGGTRKIGELPVYCANPAHNPPGHRVFPDGVYEHVCPSCGHRQVFTVANPRC